MNCTKKTWTWLPGLVFCALLAGCGAYADASGADGGGFIEDCGLSFDPNEFIRQGSMREYTVSFDTPPPWASESGAVGYLTKFEIESGDQDLEFIEDYDGVSDITVIIKARITAPTGERKIWVEARRNRQDQPQQIHRAKGKFYVLPALGTDGGMGQDGGA